MHRYSYTSLLALAFLILGPYPVGFFWTFPSVTFPNSPRRGLLVTDLLKLCDDTVPVVETLGVIRRRKERGTTQTGRGLKTY